MNWILTMLYICLLMIILIIFIGIFALTGIILTPFIFVEWLLNNNTFNFEQEITSDINLVASWKELEKDTFTVVFDSKGGNSITTQTIKKDEKALKPNDKPEVCFSICDGDEIEVVYAYCNLHGLWKA